MKDGDSKWGNRDWENETHGYSDTEGLVGSGGKGNDVGDI